MITESLIKLFTRDLNALKQEINAYKKEENIWLLDKAVTNTAGNLCLHLVGNLKTFIGASLGNTGYVRQRDLEFSQKNVPRDTLLQQVDETILIVIETLKTLTTADLQKEYVRRVYEDKMTTEYFLIHLTMHLSYHLGQINYHRRLLDN